MLVRPSGLKTCFRKARYSFSASTLLSKNSFRFIKNRQKTCFRKAQIWLFSLNTSLKNLLSVSKNRQKTCFRKAQYRFSASTLHSVVIFKTLKVLAQATKVDSIRPRFSMFKKIVSKKFLSPHRSGRFTQTSRSTRIPELHTAHSSVSPSSFSWLLMVQMEKINIACLGFSTRMSVRSHV